MGPALMLGRVQAEGRERVNKRHPFIWKGKKEKERRRGDGVDKHGMIAAKKGEKMRRCLRPTGGFWWYASPCTETS